MSPDAKATVRDALAGSRRYPPWSLTPEHFELLGRAADEGVGLGVFTLAARKEVEALMPRGDGARFVAVQCALGRYADKEHWAHGHRLAMRRLRSQGFRWSTGRRPYPALDAFVRDIGAVALFHGVPFATGDNSALVRLLRCVAGHIGFRGGDVRTALRRLARADIVRRQLARAKIFEAFSRGLRRQTRGA